MIRASEASSLNDLAEITLGWDAIRSWLAAQRSSRAVTFLKNLPEDKQHRVFVLSGSTAGDDANQWRLYADEGRGYVIRLDGAVPLGVVSLDPNAAKGTTFGVRTTDMVNVVPWYQVLYTESDLNRAMRALIKYTANELKSIQALRAQDRQEAAYESLAQRVQEERALIAHLFKAPGFVGENEVRIVARFIWWGNHVRYRAGRYGIAGYVNLLGTNGQPGTQRVVPEPDMKSAGDLTFTHPVPIREILLGPLLHEGNRGTIGALLGAYGLSRASIGRSKLPLR